jgi:hypothetical protein
MGSFSVWHWLIVLLFLILPVWLISRAVSKSGISGWWALLGLIPIVNLVMLWVFAFARWPRYPDR